MATSNPHPAEIVTLSALPSLPVAGAEEQPLRADALRNRERVLCAARRVIEEVGAEHLTMEAVATAAGVGKGTVFRRFGDRRSLLHALLDAEERDFQNAVLHGPPPLGPGAPPQERLRAYGEARLEHLLSHADVLAAAAAGNPTGGPGDEHPVQVSSRLHMAHLLMASGREPALAGVLAAALLSFLCAARLKQLESEGHDAQTLAAAWGLLVDGACADA